MIDRTAYHPEGLQVWDVWYLDDGDRVHAYYLQKPAPDVDPSLLRPDWIGHATSTDLVRWHEEPPALGPDPTSDVDDLQPWTGSAVLHDGLYHLFYTMRGSRRPAGRVQRTGLATSADGVRWTRHPGNPVLEPDPTRYVSNPEGVVDCRDLLVIPDPEGTGWLGFYAARLRDSTLSGGAAIAVAHSADLIQWEHRDTAFAPGRYACLEVPDVFELNGRWYLTCLVGNRYGDRGPLSGNTTNGTIYAVADHPAGPYRQLADDVVVVAGDTTSGYSCRSVELDGKRHLLYTEPTPSGRDSISLPVELEAGDRGALRLRYSPLSQPLRSAARRTVGDHLTELAPVPHWPQVNGTWTREADGRLSGTAPAGWHVSSEDLAGDAFEIEATFRASGTTVFGVAIGASGADTASGSVLVGIDAGRRMAVAATLPDFADLIERPLDADLSGPVHLRVIVRGERIQMYVNDHLWVQFARPWNVHGAQGFGWYVENGSVRVHDAGVWPW